MAKPTSTLLFHPRRAEIDAALDQGQAIRQVADSFGVSRSALHRYATSRPVPTRQGCVQRGAKPISSSPSSPSPSPPISRPEPRPNTPTPDLFDLRDQCYPWRPGEERTVDPMAGQMRAIQTQFGTGAVRTLILEHLFRYQLIGLPDVAIAKRLDVPPGLVAHWRAEQLAHQRAQLVLDPQAMITRELAALDQRERLAWQKVLDGKTGGKAWAAAQTTLNQVARQRLALLREAGVSLEAPLPEPPDDARHLGMVAELKGSLASFCIAVGLPSEMDFDTAIDQLPAALDNAFGPEGSPGREQAARIIKRGLNGEKWDKPADEEES